MTSAHFARCTFEQAQAARLDALRTLSQKREEYELAQAAYAAATTKAALAFMQPDRAVVTTRRRAV